METQGRNDRREAHDFAILALTIGIRPRHLILISPPSVSLRRSASGRRLEASVGVQGRATVDLVQQAQGSSVIGNCTEDIKRITP